MHPKLCRFFTSICSTETDLNVKNVSINILRHKRSTGNITKHQVIQSHPGVPRLFIPHTMRCLRPAAGWEVKVKLWICIQTFEGSEELSGPAAPVPWKACQHVPPALGEPQEQSRVAAAQRLHKNRRSRALWTHYNSCLFLWHREKPRQKPEANC